MDSSELLRIRLANRLACASQQIAIGPTGPTGGSSTIPGALKAFTIYVDYSAANQISRVYIPPYLFGSAAAPILQLGGVFTADVGTDLVFLGNPTIVLNNTTYAFVSSMNASGFVAAGAWQPINAGNIRAGSVFYSVTSDYRVTLNGLNLSNINGANTTVYPITGTAAGFLATITIFYV